MADSVMIHNEDNTYDNILLQEYNEAVVNGFAGTYEEFLQYKDYT